MTKKSILILLLLLGAVVPTFARKPAVAVKDRYGVTVGFKGVGKTIYLVFTADTAFEGAPVILNTLHKHHARGSFFFTGNCLRHQRNVKNVQRVIKEGHYVGGHSNRHILYADWDSLRTTLVTSDSLQRDIRENMSELARAGVKLSKAHYFLPPYEWCNAQSEKWIEQTGLTPVNFSPGNYTSDDYTTPDMPKYRSSQQLIDNLFKYEAKHGLSGKIVMVHPGTSPLRTDKLYNRLDEIMTRLESLGYSFKRLP
jgi:peptidoglycan/xylan/chitin deacetylase (PgdA/CDA1 family)